MSVRVRYAPSPTGFQHIGGLRTALFNYLLAKARGGKFYLRVEDTDRSRYNPEAEGDLYETLKWAGIEWDEGPDVGGPYAPYVQSQRLDRYRTYANRLVESDHAYECFCTAERLETLRKVQESQKLPQGYDGHCRTLSLSEIAEAKAQNLPSVVRFKMPREGSTTIEDQLLGLVEKRNADLPADPVLLKSDGFPTYHLAHVVDDHEMETTHVLRAQEWLPSTQLHVLLFRAFGWKEPAYCHLPLILGPDGQKLSKRHGATSVRQFKESGYLPEAVVNYLALLGWSYDDSREFFSMKELESVFTLSKLGKSPSVFDYKKLDHFNAHYIRQMNPEALYAAIVPFLEKADLVATPISQRDAKLVRDFVPLLQERLKFVQDAPEAMKFVWHAPTTWNADDFVGKKTSLDDARRVLAEASNWLGAGLGENDEDTERAFRERGEAIGFKLGDVMQPIRVAVTGGKVSPPMFATMRILGAEEIKRRLDAALAFLG